MTKRIREHRKRTTVGSSCREDRTAQDCCCALILHVRAANLSAQVLEKRSALFLRYVTSPGLLRVFQRAVHSNVLLRYPIQKYSLTNGFT